jgi:hypothetical protein
MLPLPEHPDNKPAYPPPRHNLITLLQQRVVYKLQVTVRDRKLHHIEFLLVVFKHEGEDLLIVYLLVKYVL